MGTLPFFEQANDSQISDKDLRNFIKGRTIREDDLEEITNIRNDINNLLNQLPEGTEKEKLKKISKKLTHIIGLNNKRV